jgi:hypothetical protein
VLTGAGVSVHDSRLFSGQVDSVPAWDIVVQARRWLRLSDSLLFAEALGPGDVLLVGGSLALARTTIINTNNGSPGGAIRIDGETLSMRRTRIQSTSEDGPGGEVVLRARESIALADSTVDASPISRKAARPGT